MSSTTTARVILLEDLPNVLHDSVRRAFHMALSTIVERHVAESCPIVLIVSDTGLRGEGGDELTSERVDNAVNIRTVLPPELLQGPFVTQVKFNPISATNMRKALRAITVKLGVEKKLDNDMVDILVDASHGDIRAAIMAMQFSTLVDVKKTRGKRPKTMKDM